MSWYETGKINDIRSMDFSPDKSVGSGKILMNLQYVLSHLVYQFLEIIYVFFKFSSENPRSQRSMFCLACFQMNETKIVTDFHQILQCSVVFGTMIKLAIKVCE